MGNNYDFCSSVRFSLPWNSLKYKYENNIKSEEFYLYQNLVDQVACLALDFNLDYKLCESLAYVHSFSFCDYGIAGWEVIKNYLDNNKIEIDIRQVKIEITKRAIKSIRQNPADDFYKYVEEMFSDSVITKEVKLVNECHRIIKELQPLKNNNINHFFQLEEEIIKEMKEEYLKTNDVISIDLSKYISNDCPKLSSKLDEKTYHELYQIIDDKFKKNIKQYSEKSQYENLLSAVAYFVNC